MAIFKPSATLRLESEKTISAIKRKRYEQFLQKKGPAELVDAYLQIHHIHVRDSDYTDLSVQEVEIPIHYEYTFPERPAPHDLRTLEEHFSLIKFNRKEEDVSEKKVLMWKRIWLWSSILFLITNIYAGFSHMDIPIGFIALIPYLFTYFKWRRVDSLYAKKIMKEEKEAIDRLLNRPSTPAPMPPSRGTTTILR